MDGGAEGDRTPDLVIANDALSQLSYDPDPCGFWTGAERLSSGARAQNSSHVWTMKPVPRSPVRAWARPILTVSMSEACQATLGLILA